MISLARGLAALPLSVLHRLGALVGRMVYLVSPRYRRYFRANLRAAGYADGALLGRAIAEAGKGLLELPAIWLRPHATVAGWITQVSGWDLVEAALARRRGIIFLTPHLGCFEITAQYYAYRAPANAPITVLYRSPKKKVVEPLMLAGRRRPNLRLASADLKGVRILLRALKKGEAIGILPDQAPGVGEGEWAEFFGRPAYTMTLAGRLAGAGAQVILAYAERLPRGRGYHLHLEAMPAPLAGESPARALNRALEGLIRQCPTQYGWSYNRYKVPAGAQAPT
ncbi:MAG: lipid A biosynthesis acyltransferase [Betaproteobacteria bacterium RIFCSPLOWO2_02_FULL_65_24]|nr:MAG: lipid A biosynthesis acyltransferase [Betaproteobacteria bacterium RIFCSPLOWO2_02_FULL_65_24]